MKKKTKIKYDKHTKNISFGEHKYSSPISAGQTFSGTPGTSVTSGGKTTTAVSSGGGGTTYVTTPAVSSVTTPKISGGTTTVPTTPSVTAPITSNVSKTGYYSAVQGGFVTSTGQVFPTSNPSFVPQGYSIQSPTINTSAVITPLSGGLTKVQQELQSKVQPNNIISPIQQKISTVSLPEDINISRRIAQFNTQANLFNQAAFFEKDIDKENQLKIQREQLKTVIGNKYGNVNPENLLTELTDKPLKFIGKTDYKTIMPELSSPKFTLTTPSKFQPYTGELLMSTTQKIKVPTVDYTEFGVQSGQKLIQDVMTERAKNLDKSITDLNLKSTEVTQKIENYNQLNEKHNDWLKVTQPKLEEEAKIIDLTNPSMVESFNKKAEEFNKNEANWQQDLSNIKPKEDEILNLQNLKTQVETEKGNVEQFYSFRQKEMENKLAGITNIDKNLQKYYTTKSTTVFAQPTGQISQVPQTVTTTVPKLKTYLTDYSEPIIGAITGRGGGREELLKQREGLVKQYEAEFFPVSGLESTKMPVFTELAKTLTPTETGVGIEFSPKTTLNYYNIPYEKLGGVGAEKVSSKELFQEKLATKSAAEAAALTGVGLELAGIAAVTAIAPEVLTALKIPSIIQKGLGVTAIASEGIKGSKQLAEGNIPGLLMTGAELGAMGIGAKISTMRPFQTFIKTPIVQKTAFSEFDTSKTGDFWRWVSGTPKSTRLVEFEPVAMKNVFLPTESGVGGTSMWTTKVGQIKFVPKTADETIMFSKPTTKGEIIQTYKEAGMSIPQIGTGVGKAQSYIVGQPIPYTFKGGESYNILYPREPKLGETLKQTVTPEFWQKKLTDYGFIPKPKISTISVTYPGEQISLKTYIPSPVEGKVSTLKPGTKAWDDLVTAFRKRGAYTPKVPTIEKQTPSTKEITTKGGTTVLQNIKDIESERIQLGLKVTGAEGRQIEKEGRIVDEGNFAQRRTTGGYYGQTGGTTEAKIISPKLDVFTGGGSTAKPGEKFYFNTGLFPEYGQTSKEGNLIEEKLKEYTAVKPFSTFLEETLPTQKMLTLPVYKITPLPDVSILPAQKQKTSQVQALQVEQITVPDLQTIQEVTTGGRGITEIKMPSLTIPTLGVLGALPLLGSAPSGSSYYQQRGMKEWIVTNPLRNLYKEWVEKGKQRQILSSMGYKTGFEKMIGKSSLLTGSKIKELFGGKTKTLNIKRKKINIRKYL